MDNPTVMTEQKMDNVMKTVTNESTHSLQYSLNEMMSEDFRLLQPIWDLRKGYEYYLRSPLFPVILSITFYFVSVLPWTIIDLYGENWKWISRLKIQPNKKVTWVQVRKAIALTMWNHLIYILPASVGQWVYSADVFLPEKAPTVFEFVWHQFASLAVFDFEYWAWHTIHHKIRFLYRHVHALHHEYFAPSVWVTQYLHPFELLSVGVFTTTSPWLFNAHPMTCWSFQNLSITVSVDDHIGYDLPFLPHHWMPFWGGSIQHDMHHQKPLTNFEPFFSWWDMLFGFHCPGQLAGGHKPKKLLDWEKKRKEQQRNMSRTKKRLAFVIDDDQEACDTPEHVS